jgi:hypothetical protein
MTPSAEFSLGNTWQDPMHAVFHLKLAESQQEKWVIEAGDAECFGVKAKMDLLSGADCLC